MFCNVMHVLYETYLQNVIQVLKCISPLPPWVIYTFNSGYSKSSGKQRYKPQSANSRLALSFIDIIGLLSTVMSFTVNKYSCQAVIFKQPSLSRLQSSSIHTNLSHVNDIARVTQKQS